MSLIGKRNSDAVGGVKRGTPDIAAIVTAIVSIVILILSYKLNVTQTVFVLLMVLAAIIAGYDIAKDAVSAVKAKDFFRYSVIVVFAAVVAFCASLFKEAVLLLIFYKLGVAVLDFASAYVKRGSLQYMPSENSDDLNSLKEILSAPESESTAYAGLLTPKLDIFTKVMAGVGVIFAIVMPLISDMSYTASIRRGLMAILCAPALSVLVSLPICSVIGISYSAAYGVFMRSSLVLEKTAKVGTVIFDKTDVMSDGVPKLVSVMSPILSTDAFLEMAAYVAHNSEQRIAASIIAAYHGKIKPELIGNFSDISGSGMTMTVRGEVFCLGTSEILEARGVSIPEPELHDGPVLYMSIGGKYAGRMIFSENVNPYAEAVISDFSAMDISSVLITEDGRELSEKFAGELGVNELYFECDTMQKLETVDNCVKDAEKGTVMYVSAENFDIHTPADIDAKVGYATENSDIVMSNIGLFGLPVAFNTASRTVLIEKANIIIALAVKLVLVALALTGCATMWFIVLADLAAASAAIVNSSRIPDRPIKEIIEANRSK